MSLSNTAVSIRKKTELSIETKHYPIQLRTEDFAELCYILGVEPFTIPTTEVGRRIIAVLLNSKTAEQAKESSDKTVAWMQKNFPAESK